MGTAPRSSRVTGSSTGAMHRSERRSRHRHKDRRMAGDSKRHPFSSLEPGPHDLSGICPVGRCTGLTAGLSSRLAGDKEHPVGLTDRGRAQPCRSQTDRVLTSPGVLHPLGQHDDLAGAALSHELAELFVGEGGGLHRPKVGLERRFHGARVRRRPCHNPCHQPVQTLALVPLLALFGWSAAHLARLEKFLRPSLPASSELPGWSSGGVRNRPSVLDANCLAGRRGLNPRTMPRHGCRPADDLETGPAGAPVILVSDGLTASSPLEASWRLSTGIGRSPAARRQAVAVYPPPGRSSTHWPSAVRTVPQQRPAARASCSRTSSSRIMAVNECDHSRSLFRYSRVAEIS